MKHKFFWLDAFTHDKLSGNPCAVIFSADSLSDVQLQAIAKETGLSETAFVVSSSKANFGARYFTPAEEIPLAGHPTIATMRALIEAGQVDLSSGTVRVSLELKAGVVWIDILREGEDYQIIMAQKRPEFLSTHDPQIISSLFGLTKSDLLPGVLPQTVSTGTPQLMIPVRNLDVLKRATMNLAAYKAYKAQSDFFSPHLFCLTGVTPKGATFARHFGVPPDTAEDAFTGSASGGMAAYLWRYGLIKQPKFIAEQGHWMGRPGRAVIEVVGEPNSIETVKVGGTAAVLIKGEIDLS